MRSLIRIPRRCGSLALAVVLCMLLSGIGHAYSYIRLPESFQVQIPQEDTTDLSAELQRYSSRSLVQEKLQQVRSGDLMSQSDAIRELEGLRHRVTGEEQGFVASRLGYAWIYRETGDPSFAIKHFTDVVEGRYPASPAIRADAKLRLGYLEYSRGANSPAFSHFMELAAGDLPSDSFIATDAAMRAGFIAKKVRAPRTAIEIFGQLADASPLRDDADYARLMVAGILWEMGKGDYDPPTGVYGPDAWHPEHFIASNEVCQQLMNDPDVRPEIRVIAELIHFENYIFLEEFETARELGEAFLNRWMPLMESMWQPEHVGRTYVLTNNPRRQILTALTFLMICYHNLEEYGLVIELAREIRNGVWKPEDPYRNFSVFAYSMLYEAMALEQKGDFEAGQALKEECRELHLEWYDRVEPHVRQRLNHFLDPEELAGMDLEAAAPLIESMLGMARLDTLSLEYRRRSGDHSGQLLSERFVAEAREAYGADACVIWESYLRSFTTWSARAGHHGGKGIARDRPVSEMDEQLLTNFREVLEAWKADCAAEPAEREALLREVLDAVTERRATVDEEYSARFERITAEHAELAAEMGEEYPGSPPPPLAPWELLQLDAVRDLLLEELKGGG